EDHLVANRVAIEQSIQVARVANGLTVGADDHVTKNPTSAITGPSAFETCASCRAVGRHLDDDNPGKIQAARQLVGADLHTESWSNDCAVSDEWRNDAIDRVHRHRETDPREGTQVGGVDPNQATSTVEERPAAV